MDAMPTAPAVGATGLGRANNRYEALRAVLLMLAADPQYANASIGVVRTIDRSVGRDQYYLLMHEGRALGAILWCEISAATRDACLRDKRGPALEEALGAGDAIFCTAIVSRSPEAVRMLWRMFIDANKHRDILYERHFQGERRPSRVGLVRNGRPVRD